MEKMNIEYLVRKLKEGTFTVNELTYLLGYFKENEPAPEMMALFQKAWDDSPEVSKDIDSEWVYLQVLNKVDKSMEQVHTASSSRRIPENLKKYGIPILRYAAVFILAFVLYLFVKPDIPVASETRIPILSQDQSQKITVPYGSKTKVELPDGSVVILNSGSNLSYTSNEFGSGRRSVFLEGEGFFTVTKDKGRPFYVNTHGMRVKVLGTTFNIKAYTDESIEEATLISGTVKIYEASDIKEKGKPVLLRPNEKLVFSKAVVRTESKDPPLDKKSIKPVILKSLKLQDDSETEVDISWKDDKLIFDNEPFSSLVVRIERWYDVEINLEYPDLNFARFTGRFDKETVEQVMNALSTITPFKYKIRKNQIIINK